MHKTNNMKKIMSISVLGAAMLLSTSLVFAAVPEKTNGFVCPVIKTSAVLNSPRGAAIGEGHYSIIGPNVNVPIHATNSDGTGVPPGPHSEPGDTDYTAIWATE